MGCVLGTRRNAGITASLFRAAVAPERKELTRGVVLSAAWGDAD